MALQAQCWAKMWQYKGSNNMTFKWFSRAKQHGRVSVDYSSMYLFPAWAILSVGVFLSLSAYATIVLNTGEIPETGRLVIFLCIVIALIMTAVILFYFISEWKNPGRQLSSSGEAASIVYFCGSVAFPLVFYMVLSDDKEAGYFPIVLDKKAMKEYYLPMFSFAGILFLGIASIIVCSAKRNITILKDVNGLYARYCYVYSKMPAHAKKTGQVQNQYGVTVNADEDFHAFMNSCNIFCNLPYEERDPSKWDKKNIGRYFSL